MKLQLDTKSKTIKLEESVNLGEFQETLERLLPDNQWKEYKLETNTIINNWSNPIIIDRYRQTYPWWDITPYTIPNTAGTSNNNGIYNIQC